MRQICANLLSNAIKYTPKGGRIRVHTCQEQEWAILKVQDNGRGIPPDEMENLFMLYHRIEKSEYSLIRGTGLGLFIVKSLVDAQNGCVEVHSDARDGTIFAVRLPSVSQQGGRAVE